MKRLKYLLLASLVAFAACDEETPVSPQDGSVRVTVTAGGSPLQGVTVSLGAAGTSPVTTGADGIANFPTVPVGSYTVTVSGLGNDVVCGSTTQPVTVAGGQQTAVTFACNVVSTSSISGTVADANGAPKPGATVVITRTLPAPAGTAVNVTTNTQGQYSLTGLRSGTYTVVLNTLTGCTTAATTQTVVVAAGEARVVNFVCTVVPPTPQIDSATIAIQNITTAQGGQIPTTDVKGVVIVNMGVEEGAQRVSRVELVLDRPQGDTIVYTQTFASTAPALEGVELATFNVQATINTAAFNTTTGAVAFLNGQHTLTARVFVTNRTTPQHTARVPITLTNIDFVQINTTTSGNQAFDNGGLTWRSGALTATALPVLYSGGSLSQVTLDVRAILNNADNGAAGNADPITDSVAPFVVTWPVVDPVNTAPGTDNDVGEVATPIYVRVVSSSKAGQPGPSDPTTPPAVTASNFQRLDNVAPTVPGTLNALTWIGAPTTIDTLKVPLGNVTDEGVGRIVYRVQYVVPPAAATADTAWITVNTVADIPETVVSGLQYLVRLRVEDALGNTTFTNATGPLGVDRQAPVITIVAPDPGIRTHNGAGGSVAPDLRFQVTDVGSQFGGTSPLQLRVVRSARGTPAVVCVNPNDNTTTPVPAAGCPFILDTDGTYVPSSAGVDGYYDITSAARDVAGNFAAQVNRIVLIDTTAPTVTITSTVVNTPTGGATTIQISASARDNVDLRATDTRLRFADGTVLPITTWQGETGFGAPLDTIRSVNSGVVSPMLRSLTISGTTHAVTDAGVGAFDVGRLQGEVFASVSIGGATAPAFTSMVLALSGSTVCNGTTANSTLTNVDFGCGNAAPNTRTATVTITVAGSAANPFSTMNLYARDLTTGAVRLIGQTTSMPLTLGPDFVYTATITISGPTLQMNNLAGNDNAIFAVGFSAAGDAAKSNEVNLDVRGVPVP